MEPDADPKPRVVVVVQPAAAIASVEEAPSVAPAPVAAEPDAAAPLLAATSPPAPPPTYLPAEPWTPPVHPSDRISVVSRRAIRLATFLTAVAVLATLVLWAIPTFRAANRPGFQAVRARAQTDQNLSWLVWEPRRVDPVPRWYSITATEERYELMVRGPLGQRAVVRAIVQQDRIVRFFAETEFSAQDGWRNRAFRRR